MFFFFIHETGHQKRGCVLYTRAHYTRVNTVFLGSSWGKLVFEEEADQNVFEMVQAEVPFSFRFIILLSPGTAYFTSIVLFCSFFA